MGAADAVLRKAISAVETHDRRSSFPPADADRVWAERLRPPRAWGLASKPIRAEEEAEEEKTAFSGPLSFVATQDTTAPLRSAGPSKLRNPKDVCPFLWGTNLPCSAPILRCQGFPGNSLPGSPASSRVLDG